MSTEVRTVDPTSAAFAERAALVSMSYLRRNDFRQLSHLGLCLLSAKDGTRNVLIWIDIRTDDVERVLLIPRHMVEMAKASDARIDVITIRPQAGDIVSIDHMMNVMEGL